MKKIFTCFVLGFIVYQSFGQDTNSKIKEVGLTIGSNADFGIHFKTGSGKSLFRITLLSDYGAFSKSERVSNPQQSKDNSNGIGLNLGFEKRKEISEKFRFYYGLDLINYYDRSHSESSDPNYSSLNWSISSGLGFPVGLIYDINSVITISAGIMPSFLYSYYESVYKITNQDSYQTDKRFSYSLISEGANLGFSFRFGKTD